MLIKCGTFLDEDTEDVNIIILIASISVKIISYATKNVVFDATQQELLKTVIQSINKVKEAVLDETVYVNILLYTQQQELQVEVRTLFEQVEVSLESLISKATVSDSESESASVIIDISTYIIQLLQSLGMTWAH